MMNAEPRPEHRWLQRLVGEWTYEAEAVAGPGGRTERSTGVERVRSLGDLWVLGDAEGELPGGGPATMVITLGFDPVKRRFVGTWIGSMMTHLWVYDGALDAAGRVLGLESEGPSMVEEGALARYRDAIEIVDDDHRILTSSAVGPDGAWQQFMRSTYRRTR